MSRDASRGGAAPVDDARAALMIMATDPTLGLRLRGRAGPELEAWLAALRGLRPAGSPWLRVAASGSAARLGASLDVAATLRSGRKTLVPGLVGRARGGILLLTGAEGIEPAAAALLAQELDGVGDAFCDAEGAARPAIVALDESADEAQELPASLQERLSVSLDLSIGRASEFGVSRREMRMVAAARIRIAEVTITAAAVAAICAAAMGLGIGSLRVPLQAIRIAKVAAALARRRRVREEDVALAARLTLGPRARCAPPVATPTDGGVSDATKADGQVGQESMSSDRRDGAGESEALRETIVAAARAGLPAALLEPVRPYRLSRRKGTPGTAHGRPAATAASRGRMVASHPGRPESAGELDVMATLQAAAPWQAARGRMPGTCLRLRPEDLRLARYRAPRRAITVFAVDASGSAAHGRLAEAKGAVEILLAECYIRRDEVALVAFRGRGAEILLPPTRSLTRAKRELADLPGGGGTPLAAGLDLAAHVARQAMRAGRDVVVAVLTDGRGNIGRDGTAGKSRAEADSLAAAAALRAAGLAAVVIDVSPRPSPAAARLAAAMAARYAPLPHAAAQAIAQTLQPLARTAP